MDPEFDYTARAIALKLGQKSFPVVGLRPRKGAAQDYGLDDLSPLEQVLLKAGFEPLWDFSRFQMVTHPDWTVRLTLDGTYEIDFKGETCITGSRSTPLDWCEMVRETGSVLLAFQRGPGGEVVGAGILDALATGETFAVGAELVE